MYASIALMVFCLGLDQSLVRFYYNRDDQKYKNSLLRFCVFLPTIVAAIVSVAVLLISLKFSNLFEFDFPILLLLCVFTLFSIWNRFSLLLLRVTYKSKYYAICSIASRVVYLVIVLLFANLYKQGHFLILIFSTLLSVVASTLVSFSVNRESWQLRNAEKLDNSKEILRYGLPFVLSLGLTTLFGAIDKMSLNYFCTYSEVGIYTAALSIITVFEIVQTTFNTLWSPMQIEHYVKNPEDKSFFQKGNQYITVIMFFLGLCLILFKDIFGILLGSKYHEVMFILPCLIFNPIMYTISETTHGGIEFSKKSYLNIFIALISCIVNIIGNIILVPRLGCRGAAISTGISYIVFFTLRTIFSVRLYKVDYRLGYFAILTIASLAYALYNTFNGSFGISLLMFIGCMVLLFIFYWNSIKELLTYALAYIKGLKKKN